MRGLYIKKAIVFMVIVIIMVTLGNVMIGTRSSVGADEGRKKLFTSIQVKKGDSLWTIAKERMTDEYVSVEAYIDEVCESNHIYDGKITEDMYLVVPYYK